ncbi:MAG: hypothetical protein HYZ49_16370 [Chloroflexi bacterium]|nr:hypothetical protein [Chloroflexota bacterium]
MSKTRFFLIIILAVLVLSPAANSANAQANSVAITVRAGFDGFYEDAQWIPVRITLSNTGSDINGEVVVAAPRYDGTTAEYVRPVEMPAGSRKEVFMYVTVEGYVSKITVLYRNGRDVLGNASARVTQTSPSDLIYGVLASSPSTYNILGDIDPVNGQARVATLTVEDLPPAAQAWRGLDVLIISDIDTGLLNAEQKDALKAWLSSGGRLITVAGPNWQKLAAGLADILPIVPTGTRTLSSFATLGSYASDVAPGGSLISATGDLQSSSAVVVSAGGVPLVAERLYGYGKSILFTFDPALSPIKNWRGIEGVYRNVLAVSTDRPGWSSTYRNWYNAGEAVNAIPGIGLPHPLQVCTFLGGYVFVIGPLNYVLLRRLKRRELAWITIPSMVLLFTAITYIAGFGLRGTRPTLHRLTVAQVWENSDRAQIESLIGIFSPRRSEYDLQVDGDMLLRPLPSDTYYRSVNLSLDGAQMEQSDASFVRHVRVDVGAITPFVAQGQAAAPRFTSSLTYSISSSRSALEGTITNQSDLTLRDAVVLSAGGAQRVGDIEPGSSVTAKVSLTATRASSISQNTTQILPVGISLSYPSTYYSGYDTTIEDILGTTSYYDDRETYRRYSLLTWLFDPYSTGGRGGGTYLVGWSDVSPVQASLVGDSFNVEDKTIYLIRLDPQVVVSDGIITVPPGLMTWELIDPGQNGGGAPYDSYLSQGYFSLRFRPSIVLDYNSVSSLTLHFTSYGATGQAPLLVSLWDQQEGVWVELKNLNWGDTVIKSPARFVGGDGRIDARLESPSFSTSVSVEALDFTLEVQR